MSSSPELATGLPRTGKPMVTTACPISLVVLTLQGASQR